MARSADENGGSGVALRESLRSFPFRYRSPSREPRGDVTRVAVVPGSRRVRAALSSSTSGVGDSQVLLTSWGVSSTFLTIIRASRRRRRRPSCDRQRARCARTRRRRHQFREAWSVPTDSLPVRARTGTRRSRYSNARRRDVMRCCRGRGSISALMEVAGTIWRSWKYPKDLGLLKYRMIADWDRV